MLIKLLIIDDEQTTRKGLVKHIDWRELGIHKVEEARDGVEGLEVASRFQPDIIISDIYMPGMNGIEMANHIKEQFPNCKIIFLSGYSDKEYFKAAIHLNAVSYIEKPINLDEVMHAVKKAVALCLEEEEKMLAERKIFTALSESLPLIKQNLVAGLTSRKAVYHELAKDLGLINVAFEAKDLYTAMIIQMAFPSEQTNDEIHDTCNMVLRLVDDCLDDTKHICALEDNYHIVAILSSARDIRNNRLQMHIDEIKTTMKGRNIPCNDLFCAVGRTVFGIDQIWQSYQTAQLAMQKLFYCGYGRVVYYENKSEEPICFTEGICSYFGELLQIRDNEKLISFIENLCKEINLHQETAVDEVKNIFFKLAYALFQEAEKRGVHFNGARDGKEKYIWSQISGFKTMNEMKEYLIRNTAVLCDNIDELPSKSKAVFKVLEYVQRNYSSCNLSNKALAEYVYLTPAYLSSLFKKETGKTISDYIIEVRIEKSKELLKKPRIKLFEIARAVGYSDANYYAKAFKKQVGLTPSEYREKYIS